MGDIFKGKLKRWNDDKGFGFIAPENGTAETFIHISALKNMRRRPVVGDMIEYELHTDSDGKRKAINAKIEGVALIKSKNTYRNTTNSKSNNAVQVILIVILILAGLFTYRKYTAANNLSNDDYASDYENANVSERVAPEIGEHRANFQCDGRIHCSQMKSRDEAEYFIEHCPGTQMDGDDDGVPCENDSRF